MALFYCGLCYVRFFSNSRSVRHGGDQDWNLACDCFERSSDIVDAVFWIARIVITTITPRPVTAKTIYDVASPICKGDNVLTKMLLDSLKLQDVLQAVLLRLLDRDLSAGLDYCLGFACQGCCANYE
jgi:hypothetical protein